jgi:GT2 family glycosyltransferase
MSNQKEAKSLLFVVLNYNGTSDTIKCIESLQKQNYRKHDIFLIDNASENDSVRILEKTIPKNVIFVKNNENLGFAGGVNMGIRYATEHEYEYVALINNDALLSPSWTARLVKVLEKYPEVSTATGLFLSKSGKKIESTGDSCSDWGLPFAMQRNEPVDLAKKSGFVFGGTAGASIYRTSLFKAIGLFDEKFFAYFEDTDISFRAQLAGKKAYYEKSAVAYHDHGTTSGKMPGFTTYQSFKNLPMFVIKNFPMPMLFLVLLKFIPVRCYSFLKYTSYGQFSYVFRGSVDFVKLLPYSLQARRKVQSTKKISNDYLKSILHHGRPPKEPS